MKLSICLVCPVAVLPFMMAGVAVAGNEWDEAIRSQDRQIEALESHIALLQKQHEERQAQVDLLAEMQTEVLRMGLELETLRSQVNEIESTTQEMTEEFKNYREHYRVSARIKAVGEKLPKLTTGSGKSFQDVTIKKVTDAGLVIWHKDGTTRVVFSDLPQSLRDRFQWDEQLARVHLAEESEREARWDEYLARQARQEAEKRQQQAEKAAIDRRIASLERQLQAQRTVSSRPSSLESSGRLGATRPFGTGRIYRHRPYYNSGYYYGYGSYGRSYRPTVTYYSTGNYSCRPTPVRRPRPCTPQAQPRPRRPVSPVGSIGPSVRPK